MLSVHLKQEYDPHYRKWKFCAQSERYDNSNTFWCARVQSLNSLDCSLTPITWFTFSIKSICRVCSHCMRLLRCCTYIYFLFVAKKNFFFLPYSQSKNVEPTKSEKRKKEALQKREPEKRPALNNSRDLGQRKE